MDAVLAIAADPTGPGGAAHRRGRAVLRRRRPQGRSPGRDDLPTHLREILGPLHVAIAELVRGDAPVVAAVQGSAAGAGIGLVGASDLVLAGESTKFVMAYTGVGLTPDGSSSWFLPRLVGLRRALELTFTNRVLSAAEAQDWGLITGVVPDDAAHRRGRGARRPGWRQGPPHALAAAKRLLHTSLEVDARVAPGARGRGDRRPRRARPRAPRASPRSCEKRAAGLHPRAELGVLLAHARVELGAVRVEARPQRRRRPAPRMRTASSPALRALPTPTVATGMPSGICTIDSSESSPSSCCSGTGTPITGSDVIDAVMPGRCAAPPAPAMITRRPRVGGAVRVLVHHVGRAVRGHDAHLVRRRRTR